MTAMGFYHSLNTQWIPLYVLFLFKLSRERKWSYSIWAGIFLLFTALNSYNYLVFLCMFTLIYIIYLVFVGRQLIDKHFIRRFALCIGIFLLGFSPVLYQAYQEITRYGDFVSSEIVGTDILFFFIPSILHPIFGQMAQKLSSPLSPYIVFSTVYVGYTVLALSFYAILNIKKEHMSLVKFWLLSSGMFFLFSLGPYLQINGHHIFHVGKLSLSIPLPHSILLKIPVLGGARISGRFSVMLILSLAVLTGYACSALFRRVALSYRPVLTWIFASIIFIAVVFEYLTFPYPHLYRQSIPQVYYDISQEPGDFSILQIPMQFKSGGKTLAIGSSELDLCQIAHQKRLIGGYVARVPEQVMNYFSQVPLLRSLLDIQQGGIVSQEEINEDKEFVDDFIRFFNLKYIMVHESDRIGIGFFMRTEKRDVLKNMTEYIKAIFPLEDVKKQETVTAYKVLEQQHKAQTRIDFGTQSAHFYLAYGWSPDEVLNKQITYNRMNRKEAMLLMRFPNIADRSCIVRISPFYNVTMPKQSLKIYLNGAFFQKIDLRTSWNTYEFVLPKEHMLPDMNKLNFDYHYSRSLSEFLRFESRLIPYIAFDYIECTPASTSD